MGDDPRPPPRPQGPRLDHGRRPRDRGRAIPRVLTFAAVAVAAWVLVFAREVWAGALPAAVVLGAAVADYRTWTRRGRPWHDWPTILGLLPAIGAAVWITVGGL